MFKRPWALTQDTTVFAVAVYFDLSFLSLALVPACAVQLVFITEYMTSGSLLQFLKKAKRTKKSVTERVSIAHCNGYKCVFTIFLIPTVQMWRRWCRQILSALRYYK